MLIEDFYNTMKDYKKGSYIRVSYQVPLDGSMKAAELKNGNHITKSVVKTCRLGCDYDKMAAVIEAKENGRGTRDMYEEPIIEDLLYKNKNNGRLYLRVGTVKNDNAKTIWFNNGKEITLNEAKIYLRDSYFPKNKVKPEVQNICLENVISLGGVA